MLHIFRAQELEYREIRALFDQHDVLQRVIRAVEQTTSKYAITSTALKRRGDYRHLLIAEGIPRHGFHPPGGKYPPAFTVDVWLKKGRQSWAIAGPQDVRTISEHMGDKAPFTGLEIRINTDNYVGKMFESNLEREGMGNILKGGNIVAYDRRRYKLLWYPGIYRGRPREGNR